MGGLLPAGRRSVEVVSGKAAALRNRVILAVTSPICASKKGNPHFDPFHIMSSVFIFGGFIWLSSAWEVLYKAQRRHLLAITGPYASVRHPQYSAFILIMLGFLLQWPTIPTLMMFPVLVTMYVKLAHREEKEAITEFGDIYARYMAVTPAFFPRLSIKQDMPQASGGIR